MRPQNITQTLLNHITKTCPSNLKHELLKEAFLHCSEEDKNDESIINEFENIAKKYNMFNEWNLLKNPTAPDWKIAQIRKEKEDQIANQKLVDENEKHFSKLSDNAIITNQKILYSIASNYCDMYDLNTSSENLTDKTFHRLTDLLRSLIYNPLNSNKENLESLAESMATSSSIRKIDLIYYVSSVLNSEINFGNLNQNFSKYLYILTMINQNIVNIVKGTFLKQYEQRSHNAIATIKEYILYTIQIAIPNFSDLFFSYLDEEFNLDRLKGIAVIHVSNNSDYANELILSFIALYSFNISNSDLVNIHSYSGLDKDNDSRIKVLLSMTNNSVSVTERELRVFFELFETTRNFFSMIPVECKVKLINLFMNHVQRKTTAKSREFDELEHFISNKGIYKLGLDGAEKLYKLRKSQNDSWSNLILRERDRLKQEHSDIKYKPYTPKKLCDFIFNDAILDKKDFFTDFFIKLNALKDNIEDNRDQQKSQFYKSLKPLKPKIENECRDILLIRLKDLYKNTIEFSPEKQESQNTRVDINVKCKNNPHFEIQIESKRDSNTPEIYTGIPNQLINSYLSKGVEYGIYLIFYFGSLKNKPLLLKKVKNSIPEEYKDKIKIVLIDLKY